MRRATVLVVFEPSVVYISIHALHEESDEIAFSCRIPLVISIHALHEESDVSDGDDCVEIVISIHALHEESDLPIREMLARC